MKPSDLLRCAIEPALGLLPLKMHSGHKILTAIAFQESLIQHRAQQPSRIARGFWQFEQVGIDGVEQHPATAYYSAEVRLALSIERGEVYQAIEYNDILAAAYARLLLWRHPDPIPTDMDEAWGYYLDCWKPGKPHPDRWQRSWMVG